MSLRDWRGRVALVTGAGAGIGRETSLALARRGARLILCDRDERSLDQVKQEVAAISTCLHAAAVDVADRAAMAAFADQVHALVPAVDVLVNNAGVGLSGGLVETTLEDWDWVLGINLGGVIHGCHYFVPPMLRRGQGGHVVNVASALGLWATPTVLGYATSKFAVVGLSESLHSELAPLGIGVSVVCPGLVNTRILAGTRFGNGAVQQRAMDLFRRHGCPPERVAAAILRAVERNAFMVPVSPEAWFAYYLKRFLPGLAPALGRFATKRLMAPTLQQGHTG